MNARIDGSPFTRDYSQPENDKGGPMPVNIQGNYTEGDIIEVEVIVSTHHKGQ